MNIITITITIKILFMRMILILNHDADEEVVHDKL